MQKKNGCLSNKISEFLKNDNIKKLPTSEFKGRSIKKLRSKGEKRKQTAIKEPPLCDQGCDACPKKGTDTCPHAERVRRYRDWGCYQHRYKSESALWLPKLQSEVEAQGKAGIGHGAAKNNSKLCPKREAFADQDRVDRAELLPGHDNSNGRRASAGPEAKTTQDKGRFAHNDSNTDLEQLSHNNEPSKDTYLGPPV
ncbi:MAG: hypothetical protein JRH15_23065, partial [Deltaproteobacteria bacterium]|nr:hypothetical protein [Deltaproteobacteria bacterium]